MEKEILKKAKRFDEALAMAKECITYVPDEAVNKYMLNMFPELKESEDERIRKWIIENIQETLDVDGFFEGQKTMAKNAIAWLEKQSNTNEIVNKKKIAPDILRGAAINLITWIDYNISEGNMCLSYIERKRIEDALVDGDWGKIYAYIKKKLEKQGKQKPTEWSEKDEQYLLVCKNALYKYERTDKWDANIIFNWLKSLKGRVQPQFKWSEEDCNQIETIACHLDNMGNGAMAESLLNIMDKYKSISPQNRWKPSDEQIKILNEVLNFAANHESPHWNDYIFGTLNNLIRQLKKLKG